MFHIFDSVLDGIPKPTSANDSSNLFGCLESASAFQSVDYLAN